MSGYIPAQTQEEKLLEKKVDDALSRADRGVKSWFSPFLSLREQQLATGRINRAKWDQHAFFGGYDGAERKMLAVFTDEKPEEFPIVCLRFSYPLTQPLAHRDFLGAVLGLGIKRELVGDIMVAEGEAYCFVTPVAANLLLQELVSVGRATVQIDQVQLETLKSSVKKREILHANIASLRLDAMVSAVLHKSRGVAAQLVASGGVKVNDRVVTSASTSLEQGDVFTVRGYGKYGFSNLEGQSKKQRFFVEIEKY